jgi:methionyl-tRNA synthetase
VIVVPGRYFVTTPIYYVNDVPHIGHAYTTVTADALARWHRLLGEEVFFLTGTDEHGLKIARAAETNEITPKEQADRTSARFAETWDLLDISYDRFIRTTDPDHHVAVQTFLQKVKDNGHLYKETYAGWYCVACEAYYEEDDLDPNPEGGPGLCRIHTRPVEWFEEDNWFFRLSAFTQPLLDWYERCPDAVVPAGKRNEALGLIRGGLKDISITRTSIDWGVPVPWDRDHVFYVWYDALINYATAIGYGTDPERFAKWWPHVHQLLAKDILRFHCVYWPAMLLAAGEQPPAHLHVHGYLLVGGEKMSKSKVNQIFPADLVADVGVDGFRYHFLRHAPFGPDGDVSYEGIIAGYNADLANNLGNLLSRVATVVAKKCDGIGPAPRPDSPLATTAATAYAHAAEGWDSVAPAAALEATWRLIHEANALLEATEPWKAEPGPEVDGVLGDALEVLRIVSVLASPALTRASGEVWRRIGLEGSPEAQRLPEAATWGGYPGGLAVTKGEPLFPRFKPAD